MSERNEIRFVTAGLARRRRLLGVKRPSGGPFPGGPFDDGRTGLGLWGFVGVVAFAAAGLMPGSVNSALAAQDAPAAPAEAPAPGPSAPAEAPAAPPAPADAASPTAVPPATVGHVGNVGALTDHDVVVGRWGVDVRRLGTFGRSPGQDPSCGANCNVNLTSFGVRRWTRHGYAFNAGLAVAVGSGSTYLTNGTSQTWDTHFGFGPTVGASFLLANWRHIAVSAVPQIDFVFFAPAGSRGKTSLIGVRGLVEAELHFGYWGMPELSLGFASGLAAQVRLVSKGDQPPPQPTVKSAWSIETTAPTTLDALVNNAFLRFYF